ncbi:MAG: geranylgeranyl reductase family protein [Actinomycetota bacterium]
MTERYDVLVVGGGPAGAAAGYWLAQRGRRVLVVEKKRFPREKTCCDGLTPRAVRQLEDMGLASALADHRRIDGLRSIGHGITLELAWPEHPDFPSYGYVVRRRELDGMVAGRAAEAGAEVRYGTEAVAPILDDGLLTGAVLRTGGSTTESVQATLVVVADGANSRFGRALGTARDRSYPLGMAIRGYYRSEFHDEPWIESHLDIRDKEGNHLPGYGWIFPVGDGSVNVGVGLLSTFSGWKSVNTSRLMEAFCETAPARWGITPETSMCAPTGGRLPTGGSVLPRVGPTFVVCGDAAGFVNPFNGEGISVAYETGRLAAEAVDLALAAGDGRALQTYDDRLDEIYGLYFKTARAFVRAIGNPAVMRELTRIGFRSRTLMEWVLRIMANLLRPDELGPAEAAYRSVAALVRVAPEP